MVPLPYPLRGHWLTSIFHCGFPCQWLTKECLGLWLFHSDKIFEFLNMNTTVQYSEYDLTISHPFASTHLKMPSLDPMGVLRPWLRVTGKQNSICKSWLMPGIDLQAIFLWGRPSLLACESSVVISFASKCEADWEVFTLLPVSSRQKPFLKAGTWYECKHLMVKKATSLFFPFRVCTGRSNIC